MRKTTKWAIGLTVCAAGGYMGYKVYLALGLTLGFVQPTAHAATRAVIDIGAYPLEIDPGEMQGEPKERMKQAEKSLKRHEQVRAEALKTADGDVGKVMDTLFERCKEPDAAQALFETMEELAIQSQAPVAPKPVSGETAPAPPEREFLFKTKEGESGIAHVARISQKIVGRMNTKEMGHFDAPLLEQAFVLMGRYGSPVPSSPAVEQSLFPKQEAQRPIDPVVRATLRVFMGSPGLQPFAARALGQLRDQEMAKEIIANPERYPGASIADYGDDAVRQFKEARLKGMKGQKGGVSGEGAFWQGVRLSPKHQDTAIDLARAGDGGAGLAMERNFAIQKMNSKDLDGLLAAHLDARIRFPGTRAAYAGEMATLDVESRQICTSRLPKTEALFFRGMEQDLAKVFSKEGFKASDLPILSNHGSFVVLWHTVHYKTERDICPDLANLKRLYAIYEALFRKYYKDSATIQVTPGKSPGDEIGIISGLSLFARHLGLPKIKNPIRDEKISKITNPKHGWGMGGTEEMRAWDGPVDISICLQMGHIKNPKDF